MHYKIKELHRLITTLKNEEGLSDYGVTLLEGYAVGLETVVKNCSIPAVGGSASQFEEDTFKLINAYVNEGLSKPDLVRKMKWITSSCEIS